MDQIFNIGPFGRSLMVNASGAVIIDNGPGDFNPYAAGNTGRVVCVNSQGALKVQESNTGLFAKSFNTIVSPSGATDLDLSSYNNFYIPFSEDIQISLSNPVDGAKYLLVFENSVGGKVVTFSGGNPIYWVGGTVFDETDAAGSRDFVVLVYVSAISAFIGQSGLNCF